MNTSLVKIIVLKSQGTATHHVNSVCQGRDERESELDTSLVKIIVLKSQGTATHHVNSGCQGRDERESELDKSLVKIIGNTCCDTRPRFYGLIQRH